MEPLATVVIAAQAGDRQAFAEITRRFRDNAHARAYSVLRDHHLAEDAVQEAFAEAFLNLDKLREPAAFPGWFKRIVIKRIDRLIRGKRIETVSLEAGIESPGVVQDPSAKIDLEDTGRTLHGALDLLPNHERDVARQYYFEGRSQKDIADAFGVPVTTIKKRLYASRQRLKRSLADLQPLDAAVRDEADELPLEAQLFSAARNGFEQKAGHLLAQDPDLAHAVNEDGLSIALYAAHAGHHSGNTRVVELLLARGAEIDVHTAAALGLRTRVEELLRARPSLVGQAGAWGRTPLHWAASGGYAPLAEWLMVSGAHADARDLWGCTPLHLAAELGRESVVELLLRKGADVHARLKNGKSVLQLAAQSRNPDVLRLLVRHGAHLDIFAAASLGFRDRVHALLKSDPDLVRAQLPFGATPLHTAAEDRQAEMVAYLVEQGAPLDLVSAAELGWTGAVQGLLDAEPEGINHKSGSFGYTALHSATSKGHRDLARLLLNRGAEVNVMDEMYRKTPLGEALYYGNDAMARLLSFWEKRK